ncbi:flavodoxin family protein [Fructilactobacillus frigidiflavus]|uniref:flavodoxin family protein n=1 Tax=Fructilactobacillus frigidiflavus TaxID=3242688 RepID=UPI00375807D2
MILFINASKDAHGTTAEIADNLIANDYQTLNLVDYVVYPLGQAQRADDQFSEVIAAVKEADQLVIGTPVYWSSMSAYMKILIDRMTDYMSSDNPFQNKKLSLIIDGFEPSDAIEPITHIWEHVTRRFGMQLISVSTSIAEARKQQIK